MNKFWIVWSPQGGVPTKKHETKESAVKEASRLWQQSRGKEFYVLRSVSLVHAAGFLITELDE